MDSVGLKPHAPPCRKGEVQPGWEPHNICQQEGGHTLSGHATLSHSYPGESAGFSRWHTRHHSGVPFCSPPL